MENRSPTVNGVGIGSEDFSVMASRTTPEDGKALAWRKERGRE